MLWVINYVGNKKCGVLVSLLQIDTKVQNLRANFEPQNLRLGWAFDKIPKPKIIYREVTISL